MLRIQRLLSIFVLSWGLLCSLSAHAAGSVEMQVESIVRQAMNGYNQAMESGEISEWVKYFSDNVKRNSPLSSQNGKKDFTEFFTAEFKAFKAEYNVKQIIVHGRTAAVVYTWEAQHKVSGDFFKVPMVAIYDMDTSGRFGEVTYYFDTARTAKYNKDMAGNN